MSQVEDRIVLRVTVVGLIILSMLAVLLARLWFLQVLAGQEFADAAKRNSVRLVSVEGPRGRILDRKGRVLVRNRTALAIGIRKDDLPDDPMEALKVKRRLGRLLGMSVREIDRKLADRRTSPYKPIAIAEDVPLEAYLMVSERRDPDFLGVETMKLPVREYPRGSIAAHVLGYVGEVNESELATKKGKYRLGDTIGRTGVERQYESVLRGQAGWEKLVVDATGRVVDVLYSEPQEPGRDLYLTLDASVQRVAERALAEGIKRARVQTFREDGTRFKAPAGAAVVLDARNGDVIAMASHPTFNLRKFVGGVGQDYFDFLQDEGNHFPLLNRAIQASYPPGSTYKPIIAAAALETGMGSPGGRYPCLTGFRYGDRIFRNWRARNASISIAQSLIESCDTVYYNFAAKWYERDADQVRGGKKASEVMQQWSRRFGLGTPTGIDLPQERTGRVPDRAYRLAVWKTNKAAYCKRYEQTKDLLFEDLCARGYLWRPGDSINMSIGQGDVETTPLQMAAVYAAVANGGKVVRPHLGLRVTTPTGKLVKRIAPKPKRVVRADGDTWRYIRSALRDVSTKGTASYPYRGWPFSRIPVASKTGSAEIAGKQPYSWFATYAPANDPKYVVVSVIEEAGAGSQVAGPVARRIMDHLFDLPPLPIVYGTTRSD